MLFLDVGLEELNVFISVKPELKLLFLIEFISAIPEFEALFFDVLKWIISELEVYTFKLFLVDLVLLF